MRKRNVIEIVGSFPNVYGICWSCMPAVLASQVKLVTDELEKVPEKVKQEYVKVSDMAKWIEEEFPGVFMLRLIDSLSMLGLFKTLRYRIKETPCLILNGEKISEGFPDKMDLIETIRSKLKP